VQCGHPRVTAGGRSQPEWKVNTQVIGLDVHKRMTADCILDRGGREIASGEIAGSRRERVGRRKTHLASESSGVSMWVYDLLVERYGEERVNMAQAKQTRAIANSQEKNDANDAFWLAYGGPLAHSAHLRWALTQMAMACLRSRRAPERTKAESETQDSTTRARLETAPYRLPGFRRSGRR